MGCKQGWMRLAVVPYYKCGLVFVDPASATSGYKWNEAGQDPEKRIPLGFDEQPLLILEGANDDHD